MISGAFDTAAKWLGVDDYVANQTQGAQAAAQQTAGQVIAQANAQANATANQQRAALAHDIDQATSKIAVIAVGAGVLLLCLGGLGIVVLHRTGNL